MASPPTPEEMAKWPTPNYEHPHAPFDPVVYGVEITLLVLMTISITGRFCSRTILVKNALGVDDWTMLLAYGLCTAMTACHLYGLRFGIGRHLYDVSIAWFPGVGKYTLIIMAVFAPACAMTKISICLTYLRLFPSQTNKYVNWASIIIMTGWGIGTCFAAIFQCIPISDAWAMLKPLGEKNCVNLEAFFITSAAVNSVTDCLIYLYPIRYLWRVRLSLMKRLGLITCFSLGVIITIAGAFRIWVMVIFFDTWDQTYYGSIIIMILSIEVDLGVVFGCLPSIRPIMARIFPNSWISSVGRSTGSVRMPNSLTVISAGGFRSIDNNQESIRVVQDVELSVSAKTYEDYSGRHHGREGSEEWVFPIDSQR